MRELELTVQDVKELMETFTRSKMGSFRLKQGDFCLKLESRKAEQAVPPPAHAGDTAHAVPLPVVSISPAAPETGTVVASPIVGTFYEASGPDKDPFVRVGSRVTRGDVLFIIESMKLMNEVTSEYDGTVTEIFVENAQGVEYGQPILRIQ